MDFLDLRLRVGDHIGNRNLSDMMVGFTKQAERLLNRRLRTMWQIEEFTPVWTDNEAPLPDDFQELACGDNRLRVKAGILTRTPYRYEPADIEYYAKLPTITTGPTGTNWLLEQFPYAYLYAVSVEALAYLKNVELGLATQQLLENELMNIRIEDERARYSNASVRVRAQTP